MAAPEPLVLENRHTGERLELRRVQIDGETCLDLRGTLPPRREGPPLHVHLVENEFGTVKAGRVSAVLDGVAMEAGEGESVTFPAGSVHRWWNDGDEVLRFEGVVRPLVDLDRYLQAVFQVANAGSEGRPSLVYLAHVMRRHRKTQQVRVMPVPVQLVMFGLAHAWGVVSGAYRGRDWPGCPEACAGAPAGAPEAPSG